MYSRFGIPEFWAESDDVMQPPLRYSNTLITVILCTWGLVEDIVYDPFLPIMILLSPSSSGAVEGETHTSSHQQERSSSSSLHQPHLQLVGSPLKKQNLSSTMISSQPWQILLQVGLWQTRRLCMCSLGLPALCDGESPVRNCDGILILFVFLDALFM